MNAGTCLRVFAALAVGGVFVPLAGCGSEPPAPPPHPPAAAAATAAAAARVAQNANQGPPPPPMTITDQTFVESATVRDPFRSYAREFINTGAGSVVETRDVKLRNFSLEDLRLVAVVVGTDAPYAMVVDPTHAGTILRRGMNVGRAEMIHHPDNPGGQDYISHWRVARITAARLRRTGDGTFEEIPAELVFERPDDLNPNAAIVERTLSLSPTNGNNSADNGANGSAQGVNPMLLNAGGGNPYLPPNLSGLGGGSQGAGIPSNLQGGTQTTTVYNVTQPAPAPSPAPPPTTVVVQPTPSGPPPTTPPPVQINSGYGSGGLPTSGLGP